MGRSSFPHLVTEDHWSRLGLETQHWCGDDGHNDDDIQFDGDYDDSDPFSLH